MGASLCRLTGRLFGPRLHKRILMVGLDGAGKTTILYKLKLGEAVSTVSTSGFNVESFDYHRVHFSIWDVGGQRKIRSLWHQYYQDMQAVVFVVDSGDEGRFQEARDALYDVLMHPALVRVPLLVFANNANSLLSKPPSVIIRGLDLAAVDRRKWYLQPCCALDGSGLLEGFRWLSKELTRK